MNSSAYVLGNLGEGYTQYPEDYAHKIYEEFQAKADAPSQVIIHRDKSIMYYGYVRKLDKEGQYIGLCVLLNGVMLSKMANLFAVFEKVVSELVSQGELIKMDDNGDIIGVTGRLEEKHQEVERIVTYLREEVIHWESTATKLPPISYSISNDSYRTFSITDKDEEIVEASAKYGFVCIQKNEGYDTPLLAGLRNVLKRKLGKDRSVSSKTGVARTRKRKDHGGLKILLWTIALVLVIGGLFVVSKNVARNNDLAIAVDTTVVDSIEPTTSLNNQELVLKGAISNIGFSMHLHLSGDNVEGTEQYDSQPSSQVVKISGYIDDVGTMQLWEYDHGNEIGRFSGVLSEDIYKGTWSSSLGENNPFSARVMTAQEYEEDKHKPFVTRRVEYCHGTSNADVAIYLDYPTSGPIALVESVRRHIIEMLNTCWDYSNMPQYKGDMEDGQAFTNHVGKMKLRETARERKEIEAYDELVYADSLSIKKICETGKYITYQTIDFGTHGGAGAAWWRNVYGCTFRKDDGRKVKIIKNVNNASFRQLLIRAVVNCLGDDAQYLDEEFYQNPVPHTEPYLLKNGVKFVYRKYELGYGFLTPEVVIDRNEIFSYLTDEAKKILE